MSSKSAASLSCCTVCVIKHCLMKIKRTGRTNGQQNKNKKSKKTKTKQKQLFGSYICVYPASCATSPIHLTIVKKDFLKKKTEQRKNWIDTLFFLFCFDLFCLLLPCPIKSVVGLLHMQHITRGRVTTKNCQSVTAATIVCWAPCVDRVKRGTLQKTLA